ncbi:capsular polysaccharide synthesis protein [Streptococcus sp. IsoGale021]|uniref:capsular polysaccharide synthesis protein n=1 Tax=Streptococcus TaxID=1301 RepID=UPI002000744D|nr:MULTISPECIES: capsular polysaccharide synthesis protein [Streptococcus]MCY7209836.1 capsular polysaccharide synthesis protein [Streptococcus anginosus]MCY7211411.1 capsular polysaccharide synthesis protein [Streptococcus anginosus]MCY7226538.1 capsular polysaccharide synthesis protein [Streptococcus anginosus]MDQ8693903.1 capsular polysaccharide synthesis protein [Streptococcus sp. IsoGale021]MDU5128321.1 capsular polysaccharide synthesis protein [Streptococcus anginosus]
MNNKINSFSNIFKKVNGFGVLKQYFKSGVLFFAIFQIFSQGFSKKSLEIVRNSVDNKILNKLRKKYTSYIIENKQRILNSSINRKSTNKVWVMWLQGIDNAPEIVKVCYNSLVNNLKDREVILLTEDNYSNYVTFPDYIQTKIDKGLIGKAHMSDLLRLELLENYGGTWIDATVLVSDKHIPDFIFDSDFFMYQKLKPALDGNPLSVSNWLITSTTSNPILMMTKELLYEYWKKHNSAIHYFIFHMFFQLVIENFDDEWKKVVPVSSSTPHILLLILFDNYDKDMLSAIFYQTSIHKLTYKFSKEKQNQPDTYYQKIVKDNK